MEDKMRDNVQRKENSKRHPPVNGSFALLCLASRLVTMVRPDYISKFYTQPESGFLFLMLYSMLSWFLLHKMMIFKYSIFHAARHLWGGPYVILLETVMSDQALIMYARQCKLIPRHLSSEQHRLVAELIVTYKDKDTVYCDFSWKCIIYWMPYLSTLSSPITNSLASVAWSDANLLRASDVLP